MVVEVTKRLVNVDEYYKMAEVGILKPTDHVELIYGEIYEMSPIGSKHASVVKSLARLFNKLFENEYTIGIQDPVRLNQESEPEPDISILKYRDDYYANAHPVPNDILAIIEVADSTIKYDKKVKAPLYAYHSIPVYWIIDIENGVIEVLTNPIGDKYDDKKVYHSGDELILIEKKIEFNEIFISNKTS